MLTDTTCRSAKPRDKAYKLADSKGLYLFVTTSGFRSWRWKYRFAGAEKRLTFGGYPEISLASARQQRDEAAALLRSGQDPGIARKQKAASILVEAQNTFEAIARRWHETHKQRWSKVHAADVLTSLERDVFPELAKLPISSITPPMVLQVLREIEGRPAIETAHRVRQRMSAVFVYAIASGMGSQDPAAIVKGALRPVAKGRQPSLGSIAQARALLIACEDAPGYPLTKLASRLLALTAVRPGVIRFAAYSELEDLDGPTPLWRIPAERMKLAQDRKQGDKFEFLVPLSRQAVETIAATRRLSGGGPLLFPSTRHAHRPMSENAIGYAYNRLPGYSGRHVPHGWRATFSTVMNERAQAMERPGDRAIIDLMLAHLPSGVEGAYNRAAYLPRRRELAQEWADLLMDGMPPPDTLLGGPKK
jgi:integrase